MYKSFLSSWFSKLGQFWKLEHPESHIITHCSHLMYNWKLCLVHYIFKYTSSVTTISKRFFAISEILIMSPLYRGGRYIALLLTAHYVRHISFVSVRSPRLSCRLSNTRCWHNVELLLAHRLQRWANISLLLGYRVVFDATLNVGQRHRRRANINPALASSSSFCMARARPISIGLKVWRTNKRWQPDRLAT